jgi:alpha/beta superfamily hydrolase
MAKQDLNINGPVGNLEAILHLPDAPDYSRFGIVCHPHPLQEGTMQHKVVSTVVKAFNASGIPCLRFNFRGVGNSEGIFGHITGEVEDCLAVVNWVSEQWPNADLYLAGFSFGAYVAAEVATKVPTKQLISIAPSVERMPYAALPRVTCPWLVIMGEEDEIVVPQAVFTWFEHLDAQKTLVKFPATGHFFHGKLVLLQEAIQQVC